MGADRAIAALPAALLALRPSWLVTGESACSILVTERTAAAHFAVRRKTARRAHAHAARRG